MREEKCYFCGTKTIRFHEHYYFCPECSAIYTYLIIQQSSCTHITTGVDFPTVIRVPWYKKVRDNKIYIRDDYKDDNQRCSVCSKICVADGW